MRHGIPVSVLVQTKNESVGIEACLEGLTSFDEVIVVDSNSDDGTVAIASRLGATVVNFTWDGRYPKKKQWQLENVTTRNEWVLFLDADESPSAELVREIETIVKNADEAIAAVDVDLDYVFAGRKLRFGHRVTKRCLVRRNRVRFPRLDDIDAPGMGELEGHYQPEADGKVARVKGRIVHNDLDPVSSWFSRHNRYSDWEAHLRSDRLTRTSVRGLRSGKGKVFERTPFKPLVFFLYSYVARLGFLDGRAGFDYAFALAGYYWQIDLKYRELMRSRELVGRS